MRIFITIQFVIVFHSIICAQNLLPNGSFELTTNLIYPDPGSAFSYLDYWYRANYYTLDPTYKGSPDLFEYSNRLPLTDPPNFWNVVSGAADGAFHVGIANHLTYEGYFTPEATATPLVQPLEANEYYHIELQFRNKGVSAYLDHIPMLCDAGQNKKINILLNPDSIVVTIDGQNKNSYTNASRTIELQSLEMEYDIPGKWHKIGTCFQANGDEKYLGISTPTGGFSVKPPCVIHDDHWDVFYVYYFDIDDIKLTKLPDKYLASKTICAGRTTKINIAELAGLPVMQNEIEYHWDDGRIDSINYLVEPRTYFINAITDCTTIPIILEIDDLKCDPDIFVPNAFSPNGDGINDRLETYISSDLPIMNYQFAVYNRWGSKIFESINSDIKWDGTFQGNIMDNGVYTWLLEFTLDDIELGITNYKESGDVMIIW